ncbi:MAG: hypothetical protein ACE5E4_13055 [Candidatus Binatia bacterium]
MMWGKRDELRGLFEAKTVADLAQIRKALGGVSVMTAYRRLKQIGYRRSYNMNGRFYALYDPKRFDRFGLWSVGGIHFSIDGSLRSTVRRLVKEAQAGMTHREFLERLRVRVQSALLDLLHNQEVDREKVEHVYVYLHIDAVVRAAQLEERRRQAASFVESTATQVSDRVVIAVLLTLIRHPGAMPAQTLRHLRGYSPAISFAEVEAVFARYGLEEKGGPWIC